MALLTQTPELKAALGLPDGGDEDKQTTLWVFQVDKAPEETALRADNRTHYSISRSFFNIVQAFLSRQAQKRTKSYLKHTRNTAVAALIQLTSSGPGRRSDMATIRRLMFERNVATQFSEHNTPDDIPRALGSMLTDILKDGTQDIIMFHEGFDNAALSRSQRENPENLQFIQHTLIGTKAGALRYLTGGMYSRMEAAWNGLRKVAYPSPDADHDKDVTEAFSLFRDKTLEAQDPDRMKSIVVPWPLAHAVAQLVHEHEFFFVELCLNKSIGGILRRIVSTDSSEPNLELLNMDTRRSEMIPLPRTVLQPRSGPGNVVAEDNVPSVPRIEELDDDAYDYLVAAKERQIAALEAEAVQRALQKEKKARMKANRKARWKEEESIKKAEVAKRQQEAEDLEMAQQIDPAEKRNAEEFELVKKAESAKQLELDKELQRAKNIKLAQKQRLTKEAKAEEKAELARKQTLAPESEKARIAKQLTLETQQHMAMDDELARLANKAELASQQQLGKDTEDTEMVKKANNAKQTVNKDVAMPTKFITPEWRRSGPCEANTLPTSQKGKRKKALRLSKRAEIKSQAVSSIKAKTSVAPPDSTSEFPALEGSLIPDKTSAGATASLGDASSWSKTTSTGAYSKVAPPCEESYSDAGTAPAKTSGHNITHIKSVLSFSKPEITGAPPKVTSTIDFPRLESFAKDTIFYRTSEVPIGSLQAGDQNTRPYMGREKTTNDDQVAHTPRSGTLAGKPGTGYIKDDAETSAKSPVAAVAESSPFEVAKTRADTGKMERRNSIIFLRSRTDSRAAMIGSPLAPSTQGWVTPAILPTSAGGNVSGSGPSTINIASAPVSRSDKHTALIISRQPNDDGQRKPGPKVGTKANAQFLGFFGDISSTEPTGVDRSQKTKFTAAFHHTSNIAPSITAAPSVVASSAGRRDVDASVVVVVEAAKTQHDVEKNARLKCCHCGKYAHGEMDCASVRDTAVRATDGLWNGKVPAPALSYGQMAFVNRPSAPPARVILRNTDNTLNDVLTPDRFAFLERMSSIIRKNITRGHPGGEVVQLKFPKAHAAGGGIGSLTMLLPERRPSNHRRGKSFGDLSDGQLSHSTRHENGRFHRKDFFACRHDQTKMKGEKGYCKIHDPEEERAYCSTYYLELGPPPVRRHSVT